jgi:hypothetical protein
LFLCSLSVVDVLSDRYGSHVLESVLFRLPSLLAAESAALNEEPAEALQQSTASTARAQQAWRNVGTHSKASVEGSGPNAKRTPLRAHVFQLVTRLIPDGEWIALASHAHASFALRHIVHILAGETNIKAMADTTGSKPGVVAPSATVDPAIPAYLAGLEELLPWMTQEVVATEADELEATARSASAVPVLQSLLRAVDKSARALGDSSRDGAPVHPARVQLQSMMAKLLQFPGADETQWTPEQVTQSTKK